MSTNGVGNKAEAAILAKFVTLGYVCSIPFGNGARYDLIVDRGEDLLKVQIKHGRIANGCVQFNTYSVTGGKTHVYTEEDIDAYAIYCSETTLCYFVPYDASLPRIVTLRIDPVKVKRDFGSRFAKDYEI